MHMCRLGLRSPTTETAAQKPKVPAQITVEAGSHLLSPHSQFLPAGLVVNKPFQAWIVLAFAAPKPGSKGKVAKGLRKPPLLDCVVAKSLVGQQAVEVPKLG